MNSQQQFLRWSRATVGTREGSTRQRRWAAAAGVAWTAPWCSVWIAYGLRKAGIAPPSNPAYSGSWLDWDGGTQVEGGLRNARPGDLLIFDWGDGGITDHVGAYLGGGRMIAGNNSNNTVGTSTVPTGNLVGIVRPKEFAGGGDSSDVPVLGAIPGVNAASDALNAGYDALFDAAGDVVPDAAEIAAAAIAKLADLLGINAPAIALNVALVGGGAFLVYYGVAKMAGVDEPVMQAYARTPSGAAVTAVAPG